MQALLSTGEPATVSVTSVAIRELSFRFFGLLNCLFGVFANDAHREHAYGVA